MHIELYMVLTITEESKSPKLEMGKCSLYCSLRFSNEHLNVN